MHLSHFQKKYRQSFSLSSQRNKIILECTQVCVLLLNCVKLLNIVAAQHELLLTFITLSWHFTQVSGWRGLNTAFYSGSKLFWNEKKLELEIWFRNWKLETGSSTDYLRGEKLNLRMWLRTRLKPQELHCKVSLMDDDSLGVDAGACQCVSLRTNPAC